MAGKVGAWSPIKDPTDPHVQGLGKFAVSEYNKEKKHNLTFKRVLCGLSQVVAGFNYRLYLEAVDDKGTKTCEAVVYERAWEDFKCLTSFTVLVSGKWPPIVDVEGPHVQELGKFAVSEYNKKSKQNLTFKRVVSGTALVVDGVIYNLFLEAVDHKVPKICDAVVYERENFKCLVSFTVLGKA